MNPGSDRQLGLPALGLITLAAAAFVRPAHALGLDEAEVAARLGQPLSVAVPIRVSAEEARYVEARLISIKAPGDESFEESSVAGRGFKAQVVADRRGRLVVQVTSSSRVMEPYFDLAVEVQSRNTRVQRQFTVFIDPPADDAAGARLATMIASSPEVTETIQPQLMVADAGIAPQSAVHIGPAPMRAPAPRPDERREPVVIAEDEPGRHIVRRGESLSAVARAFAHAHHLTTAQAADRLYRGNPDAFRGSPDLLLAGAQLSLTVLDDSAGMLAVAPVAPVAPHQVTITLHDSPSADAGAPLPEAAATEAALTEAAQAAAETTSPDTTEPTPAAPVAVEGASIVASRISADHLKMDDHLSVPPAVAALPVVTPDDRNVTPGGVVLASLTSSVFTSLIWFGGMALLRARTPQRKD